MRMSSLLKVVVRFYDFLVDKLDGKKLWKEELRKAGLLMFGLGCSGPFINNKSWMAVLAFLGVFLELLGLSEDSIERGEDV